MSSDRNCNDESAEEEQSSKTVDDMSPTTIELSGELSVVTMYIDLESE